jgi:hypothetical protein
LTPPAGVQREHAAARRAEAGLDLGTSDFMSKATHGVGRKKEEDDIARKEPDDNTPHVRHPRALSLAPSPPAATTVGGCVHVAAGSGEKQGGLHGVGGWSVLPVLTLSTCGFHAAGARAEHLLEGRRQRPAARGGGEVQPGATGEVLQRPVAPPGDFGYRG